MYDNDGEERLFTGHTGRLFLLLTGILICLQLSRRLLPPLLPAIIDDLGISTFFAGVAISTLRLSRASMEYPGGRSADQLSRSTVILAGIVFGVLGVTALWLSPTYSLFLLGIVLLGISLGLYIPASRTLLTDLFEEKRGRAFGLNMLGGDISGILAAGMAIWFVSVATWRHAFLPVALALLPFPVAFYYLSRESKPVERIEFGLSETVTRVFGDPSMRWLVIAYSLLMIASSGVLGFLPAFLVAVHGVSFAFASGTYALVFATGLVARPVSGVASDRIPRPVVSGGSFLLASVGLAALIVSPFKATLIAGVIVFALGQKGVTPALQAYVMDRIPEANKGSDFGAFRMIYKAVGSVGPAYTGFVADQIGFVWAFTSLIAFLLLAGGVLLWFARVGWPSEPG